MRRSAAEALGKLGPAADSAVPELARLLGDPEAFVRVSAAEALGRLGPAAGAAVPELMKSIIYMII
jgi:HEAT repeat protein